MTTLINRRHIRERRKNEERRLAPRLDLTHKRRRINHHRRETARSLVEDFLAKEALANKHLISHQYH